MSDAQVTCGQIGLLMVINGESNDVEVVMACVQVLISHSPTDSEENHDKHWSRFKLH
jgi:hypothetical protein